MSNDGWIVLTWMVPIYCLLLLPTVVIAHVIARRRPKGLHVLAWLGTPVTVWWICTSATGRWLALLNAFVEPLLLGSIAAALYLWVTLSEPNDGPVGREDLTFLLVVVAAAAMGLLFPSLGSSP